MDWETYNLGTSRRTHSHMDVHTSTDFHRYLCGFPESSNHLALLDSKFCHLSCRGMWLRRYLFSIHTKLRYCNYSCTVTTHEASNLCSTYNQATKLSKFIEHPAPLQVNGPACNDPRVAPLGVLIPPLSCPRSTTTQPLHLQVGNKSMVRSLSRLKLETAST